MKIVLKPKEMAEPAKTGDAAAGDAAGEDKPAKEGDK